MKKSIAIRARGFAPVLSLVALAVSDYVQAQAIEVNPIVVTASRVAQPLSEVLSSVSVITQQDIEKSQASALADLLQGEAGFEFGRNGGPGTTTSLFLRGQESKNLVIFVDGVRSQVDSLGSLQVIDVPLQQIQRIEILRGNASALYGDAALGGVINIFTKQGKGVPQSFGQVTYGSRQTAETTVGYGGAVDAYSFNVLAGATSTEGFSAINTNQKTGANPDIDGARSKYFSGNLQNKLSANTTLGVRFNWSQAAVDTDNAFAASPTYVHQFLKNNNGMSGYWRQVVADDWVSTLDLSTTELKYEDQENGTTKATKASYSLFNGKQNALRWTNHLQWSERTAVTFGAERSLDDFSVDAGSTYTMQRTGNGYFAGLSQKLGERLALQTNLRRDQVAMSYQSGASNADNNNQKTTGLVGLGYTLNEVWSLSTTASSGFRAPTASEVSKNPLLKPERHQTREAGVTYAAPNMLLRWVYFESQTTDAIIYKPLSGLNYTYEAVGSLRNKGIETTLRTSWQAYGIKASLVTQDPWNDVTQKGLDRRAKQYGSIDVSRQVGLYEVGAKTYTSGQRSDGSNTLAGYTLWTFYASRKIDKDWTARLKLENAFDREYQLAYGYNTPGRGIYATLQYQPK